MFRFLISTMAVVVTLAAGLVGGAEAQTYGVCPSSGLTASANMLNLKGDCAIVGDVNLSGSATLTMTGGVLSIKGNIILNDNSSFTVTSATLSFPQTNYNQYAVTLNGNSQLSLTNSVFITNSTQQNNFSMLLQAKNSSVVTFVNSKLDTSNGSWLLGNFRNNSMLNVINSQTLPTEIYPFDAAKITVSGSSFAGMWLDFASGTKGTVQIPAQDAQSNYNFSFGPSTGIAYSVNISSSHGRLGFNSHPNSTMIVNGHGTSNDADVVFGYYVENSTAPVTINGLTVGSNVTRQFTDLGRNLQLNNVHVIPFAWQVYVNQSNNFPVTVTNSTINEIAVFTNAVVNVSNSTLQLAVTGAMGPGSRLNINTSQIWSQTVQAQSGGQVTITNSQLHGNFISAAGAGSKIIMNNVPDNRNGVLPQSCAPVAGSSPNNNGVPLCNPLNPLYQCAQVIPPMGGATIIATPSLTCPPL